MRLVLPQQLNTLAYLLLYLLSLSALFNLACVCSVCVYCLLIFYLFQEFESSQFETLRSKSHISESYSTQPHRRFEFEKKKRQVAGHTRMTSSAAATSPSHTTDSRTVASIKKTGGRLHADDEQPHLRFIQQTAVPPLRI